MGIVIEVDGHCGSSGYISNIRHGEIKEGCIVTISHMLPSKPTAVIVSLGTDDCVSRVTYIGKHVFRFQIVSLNFAAGFRRPESISFQAIP